MPVKKAQPTVVAQKLAKSVSLIQTDENVVRWNDFDDDKDGSGKDDQRTDREMQ